jgi:lactate permease
MLAPPIMIWIQNYDPLHSAVLSTLVAALPLVVLLGAIAFLHMRAHLAALLGLGTILVVAVGIFGMPWKFAGTSLAYGAAYGLFPIGWIILNLIFLYELTCRKHLFNVLRANLGALSPDPRVQVILVAFCFGAFFEGAAGFGTPVAVTSALLIQLGFKPLQACGLSLIANTAPVAFGGLGTPIIALAKVSGIDEIVLSKMIGRQLPFFSLMIPFWVVWTQAGFRGMCGVWPVALVAGASFAVPQFLISNFHGPWLVDIVAALCSLAATVTFLKFWQPRPTAEAAAHTPAAGAETMFMIRQHGMLWRAWMPWLLLSVLVFVWGVPKFKSAADAVSAPSWPMPELHEKIQAAPPIAHPPPAGQLPKNEPAIFRFNWLSATGTSIFVSALLAGAFMGYRPQEMARIYGETIWRIRFSLLTIAAMLALGSVTRYSGTDATLGLALAHTGCLYPFFGTLLGWLGVALTGSDTSSNVLFGSLQRITAEQTGVSPTLMAAANSSGGVMGKMVDAQSIVVGSTATNWYGHEGEILRFVFFHSLALAALMGLLVLAQAYVPGLTGMVPK